jgi:energy-coupling factor transporter ATP-binding protein EcfA2
VTGIGVDFKNCYGIHALTHEFDCTYGRVFLLYAPNGSMKTSFARAFADVSQGREPRDAIFPHRETVCSIRGDGGEDLVPEQILVIEPYLESFASQRTATLMVNQDLRLEYEALVEALEDKANAALAALGKAAGLRRDVQIEIAKALGAEKDDAYHLLERLHSTLQDAVDPGLAHIGYAEVFSPKVLDLLSSAGVRSRISEYVDRFNELVDQSTYFRRGVFNHYDAMSVRKSLADHGFFRAKHSVSLADRDSNKSEINTPEELDTAIEAEKQHILSDSELSKRFHEMDKAFNKNVESRAFRSCLEANPELMPELRDVEGLRRKMWLSYALVARASLDEFAATFHTTREKIDSVAKAAQQQETEWRHVLAVFRKRFSVPFCMDVANQHDVILKDEAPSLVFEYLEGGEGGENCVIAQADLLRVLSTGEKRALYLLNVIFELEARKKESEDTILVLDDVADSFDYKNKYAIVEYLREILDSDKFTMLILTHNFDFFRTVQGRLAVDRRNCLMAVSGNDGVQLTAAEYLQPFEYWRKHVATDRKILVASIPMVRNLVEYARGRDADDYIFLTSILHVKADSDSIEMNDLAEVLRRVLGATVPGGPDKVVEVIAEEARSCDCDGKSIDLEKKVVLSIAIRLQAERLMIVRISDPAKTGSITSNQTRTLFDLYKQKVPDDREGIELLERVMLMTPEAIHLNSFMYEPILDMSHHHLRTLHDELATMSA